MPRIMIIDRHINDQSFCYPRIKEDEHQKQHKVEEDAVPEIVGIMAEFIRICSKLF